MGLDRRRLLLTAAAAAIAPSAMIPAATLGDAKLNVLLDAFMDEQMRRSPELVTTLGLDKDSRAEAKSRLDERSTAARTRIKAENLDQLRRLELSQPQGSDGVGRGQLR